MPTVHESDSPAAVVAAWEAQQDAFVHFREQRFDVMLDVLGLALDGGPRRVLDLAGGCGSIAARLRRRFPGVEVVVADKDPVLLDLARATLGDDPAVRVVDVDLDDPAWAAQAVGPFDAVLSATALHWLPPHVLARLYADLATVTDPGAIFMNADHLQYDAATQPTLHAVAARDDELTQAAGHAAGAMTWQAWWERAEALPGFSDAARRRAQVWAGKNGPTPRSSLDFHLTALRAAGWAETGTLWRHLDDVVVFARRP